MEDKRDICHHPAANIALKNRDHFSDGEIPEPQITGIPEGVVPIFQIAELVTCEGIQGPKITSYGPEAEVDIL